MVVRGKDGGGSVVVRGEDGGGSMVVREKQGHELVAVASSD